MCIASQPSVPCCTAKPYLEPLEPLVCLRPTTQHHWSPKISEYFGETTGNNFQFANATLLPVCFHRLYTVDTWHPLGLSWIPCGWENQQMVKSAFKKSFKNIQKLHSLLWRRKPFCRASSGADWDLFGCTETQVPPLTQAPQNTLLGLSGEVCRIQHNLEVTSGSARHCLMG